MGQGYFWEQWFKDSSITKAHPMVTAQATHSALHSLEAAQQVGARPFQVAPWIWASFRQLGFFLPLHRGLDDFCFFKGSHRSLLLPAACADLSLFRCLSLPENVSLQSLLTEARRGEGLVNPVSFMGFLNLLSCWLPELYQLPFWMECFGSF